MKTLKEYNSNIPVEPAPEVVQEDISLELLDSMYGAQIESLDEDVGAAGLPAVLIMRRKSFRQFPSGQKVALYYIDKLDKYVPIPYGKNADKMLMQPSMKESVIDSLKQIVESDSIGTISFDDGSLKRVDVYTAESVLKVYNSLNRETKTMIEEMVQKNKEHFNKVVDFAHKQFNNRT